MYQQYFGELRDVRGCGIKSTNTRCELIQGLVKGHTEIATPTYHHAGTPDADEILGAKTYLVNECGVVEDTIAFVIAWPSFVTMHRARAPP